MIFFCQVETSAAETSSASDADLGADDDAEGDADPEARFNSKILERLFSSSFQFSHDSFQIYLKSIIIKNKFNNNPIEVLLFSGIVFDE